MVLPTGGGKTVIFCYMVQQAVARGKQVLIIVHRQELVEQVSKTLDMFGIDHRLCCPGHYRTDSRVIVASVFSAIRRRLPRPGFVICDEAHHACAGTTWGRLMQTTAGAYQLGVTATPIRLSGEGLEQCFDDMVVGPTTADLIAAGHLCDYRMFRPPTVIDRTKWRTSGGDYNIGDMEASLMAPRITGDAVEHYERLSPGARAVVFGVTVRHCNEIAGRFEAAGHPAGVLTGDMPRQDRTQLVRDFAAGKCRILVSCNVISEGFDLPAIETAILLRPTQSLSLYLQQVGRALRTYPGKEKAVILDHVGNVDKHGLPCIERDWSLAGRKKRSKADDEATPGTKLCEACFAINPVGSQACSYCGTPFASKERKIQEEDGSLQEIKRAPVVKQPAIDRLREQHGAQTYSALLALGMKRGYKFPAEWARHVLNSRRKTKPTQQTWTNTK